MRHATIIASAEAEAAAPGVAATNGDGGGAMIDEEEGVAGGTCSAGTGVVVAAGGAGAGAGEAGGLPTAAWRRCGAPAGLAMGGDCAGCCGGAVCLCGTGGEAPRGESAVARPGAAGAALAAESVAAEGDGDAAERSPVEKDAAPAAAPPGTGGGARARDAPVAPEFVDAKDADEGSEMGAKGGCGVPTARDDCEARAASSTAWAEASLSFVGVEASSRTAAAPVVRVAVTGRGAAERAAIAPAADRGGAAGCEPAAGFDGGAAPPRRDG